MPILPLAGMPVSQGPMQISASTPMLAHWWSLLFFQPGSLISTFKEIMFSFINLSLPAALLSLTLQERPAAAPRSSG